MLSHIFHGDENNENHEIKEEEGWVMVGFGEHDDDEKENSFQDDDNHKNSNEKDIQETMEIWNSLSSSPSGNNNPLIMLCSWDWVVGIPSNNKAAAEVQKCRKNKVLKIVAEQQQFTMQLLVAKQPNNNTATWNNNNKTPTKQQQTKKKKNKRSEKQAPSVKSSVRNDRRAHFQRK